MMKIRPEQVASLQAAAMADYEARALAHLRGPLGEVTAGRTDDELRARVRASIPRAERHGLKDEQEVVAFVDTSLLLDDERFDDNPAHGWAAAVLGDTDRSSREKAVLLLSRATDEYTARKAKPRS